MADPEWSDAAPEWSDAAPEWSDEHVSRGNKFTLQVVLAWVALVVLNALFGHTGAFGFVLVGVATLFATWVLVHALFEHVDQLVQTRIEEAVSATQNESSDAAAGDESSEAEFSEDGSSTDDAASDG